METISVTTIENSPHYKWGKDADGWHFLKRDDLSIIVEEVPAGESEVKHYHAISRQFFYILFGVACIEIDQTIFTLKTDQGIEIPPGVPHRFFNSSDLPVKFIVVSMPKSHGDRTVVSGSQ